MEKYERERKIKIRKLRLKLFAILLLFAVGAGVLWKLSDNSTFETTFYRVTSEKIGENIRAVVLADLHNNVFGQDNEPLVFKIRQLEPDVILMAGDMINGDDPDVSGILELCVKLKDIAPIYYSLGNNEGVLMYSPEGPQVPLDVELLEEGVTVLYNNSVDTEIRGNKVSIGAVTSEPADFAEMSQEFIAGFEQSSNYKILLAHYPTLFYDCLADADIDLSVSGHFHGGQVRLRHLLTMSSGFHEAYLMGADRCAGVGAPDYVKYMLSRPVKVQPGSEFVYSTADSILAGRMVEKAVGKRLSEYLYDRIFAPLGQGFPIWENCPQGHPIGGGGMFMTLSDMLKIGQVYLMDGKWKGQQLVDPAWVKEATAKQIETPNPGNDMWVCGYGYQFWRNPYEDSYRADGAYGQLTMVLPKKGLIVSVQCPESGDFAKVKQPMHELILSL